MVFTEPKAETFWVTPCEPTTLAKPSMLFANIVEASNGPARETTRADISRLPSRSETNPFIDPSTINLLSLVIQCMLIGSAMIRSIDRLPVTLATEKQPERFILMKLGNCAGA
uniref:Uncharacterized protein n=1 Tax=Yersinia enterocolitica TaxID=630 RepID=B0RL10_YEREN|nr:hypothetical protein [Yersinia enterocolitica]